VEWFRNLPGTPKLIFVGLAVLVLLVLLSPVAAIIAALLFGVSIIALIIRVVQKGSIKNWGIVAVTSVVLMFTFGGISDALYGIGFVGSSGTDSGKSSETPGGSDRSGGETDVATGVAYDVVSEEAGANGGWNYYVVSSATDLESLNLVAQDIQRERLQTGDGVIFFKSQDDVPPAGGVDGLVGVATIYQDETWTRNQFLEGPAPLSTEQIEQVVDVIADNGYVLTTVEGEHLPKMPDFMYEAPNKASATATASASATPSAGDGSYAE